MIHAVVGVVMATIWFTLTAALVMEFIDMRNESK